MVMLVVTSATLAAADGYNVFLIRRGCLWQDGEQQLFWFTQSSFQSHTKNVEQANMFSAMHAPKADHGELKKEVALIWIYQFCRRILMEN